MVVRRLQNPFRHNVLVQDTLQTFEVVADLFKVAEIQKPPAARMPHTAFNEAVSGINAAGPGLTIARYFQHIFNVTTG